MTRTGREGSARAWGTLLAGVSIVGTIIASMAVFVLAMLMSVISEDFGGGAGASWAYWLVALAFAVAGLAGLVLTSRLPSLAYLLRAAALVPALLVGLLTPWVLALPALVLAADLSLLLSHWTWGSRPVGRWMAAIALGLVCAGVTLPSAADEWCDRPRDPGSYCEVTYDNAVGMNFQEGERALLGWVLVAALVTVVVGLPVLRDEQDVLI